jgi:hypothetical protein
MDGALTHTFTQFDVFLLQFYEWHKIVKLCDKKINKT